MFKKIAIVFVLLASVFTTYFSIPPQEAKAIFICDFNMDVDYNSRYVMVTWAIQDMDEGNYDNVYLDFDYGGSTGGSQFVGKMNGTNVELVGYTDHTYGSHGTYTIRLHSGSTCDTRYDVTFNAPPPPPPTCNDPEANNNGQVGDCTYTFVNYNFVVGSSCGGAVSGATVTINRDFGGGTVRTTDGGGFANFGVYQNVNLNWSVSKSGYGSANGTNNSGNSPGTTIYPTLTPSGGCTAPASTASISANPTSITTGGSSTITWSSTNALSCSVSPSGWTGTSGSQSTGSLSNTTTYTVTCNGTGGDSSNSVTVTVSGVASGSLSASPNPCSITSPATTCSSNITWSTANVPSAAVYFSTNGGAENLFASGLSGTQAATWIEAGNTYVFRLRDTTTNALLSSITVAGSASSVAGSCGTANKTYSSGSTGYGTDTFCSTGTASPASPAFPTAGSSTNWICLGANGGANSPQCTANLIEAAGGTYSLTVNKSGNGLVVSNDGTINCGSTCARTYPQNTSVTLTATPVSTYWKFAGWAGDCSGLGECVLLINRAKSVTATFHRRIFNYFEF